MLGLLTMVAQLTQQAPVVSTPPHGDAAGIFSTGDYPEGAILLGQEGTVGVLLTIGADGRVAGCTIEESSGFGALDTQTCTLFSSRGRFQPARNSRGEPIGGSFSQRVKWLLPDNALPIASWTIRLLVALDEKGIPGQCSVQVGGALKKKRSNFVLECSHLSGAFTIPPELAKAYLGRKTVLIFDQQFVPRVVNSINTPPDLKRFPLLSRDVIHFEIDGQGSVTSCGRTRSEASYTPAVDGCNAMRSRRFKAGRRGGSWVVQATTTMAIYAYAK